MGAREAMLQNVIREVCKKHTFHTLILYGSHARGDATAASDVDLLAIRKGTGAAIHDARHWRGVFLDVFVYPESKIDPQALLRIRGGRVLLETKGSGQRLLARINRVYARGPKRLPADERKARKVWAQKMLQRIRAGDLEGHFRRVWLLTALLEDYFVLRERWYEGPKVGFQWLRENDRKTAALFERALKPNAKIGAIAALVAAVIAR